MQSVISHKFLSQRLLHQFNFKTRVGHGPVYFVSANFSQLIRGFPHMLSRNPDRLNYLGLDEGYNIDILLPQNPHFFVHTTE